MKIYKMPTNKWFLERMIYLMAGIFVTASVILGFWLSVYFFLFTGFVGVMLINFALTGYCPMAILLYNCKVKEKFSEINLDQYEKELGFKPVWIELKIELKF